MGWTLDYPDIKPCPFCGRVECYQKSYGDKYWVECPQCRAKGPMVSICTVGDKARGIATVKAEINSIVLWNERKCD